MKHIFVPHSKGALITFNKGGSTLFTHTFKFFCDWKGIEIQNDWGRKDSGNIVVISRNPINRFYSGFLHKTIWMRGINGLKEFEWIANKNDEAQLIELLNTFIGECESGKIEEMGDQHYVRQGEVLKGMKIENFINYQIEYLHPQIQESGIWKNPSSNADFGHRWHLVENEKLMENLPLFGDLDIQLSGWDAHFFCSTYQLVLRNLNNGHHKGDSEVLRRLVERHYPSIGKRIRDWVWEDVKRFGYE